MLRNCDSGVTEYSLGAAGSHSRLGPWNRGAIVPNRLNHVLRRSVGLDLKISLEWTQETDEWNFRETHSDFCHGRLDRRARLGASQRHCDGHGVGCDI